jgi:hypothetical protein
MIGDSENGDLLCGLLLPAEGTNRLPHPARKGHNDVQQSND